MAHTGFRLPGGVSRRARDILEGRQAPAEPRNAATVMLLRPAGPPGARAAAPEGGGPDPEPFSVYLLRRRPSMAFAPGAYVFPGGSVDPRDADAEVAWAGPDVAAWAVMLDAPADLARALVCAAVRETFEECGVLLAGPTPADVVADIRGDDWEADRRALTDRSLSLAGMLARRELVLRSDLLKPWARWITPETESRRFDTRFFAAALPAGQRTADVPGDGEGEADAAAWLSPSDAIAAARRKEIFLLPPTAVSLAELSDHDSVAAVLSAPRELAPMLPTVSLVDGEPWLNIPQDVEYPL